jgi:hypothetical protein
VPQRWQNRAPGVSGAEQVAQLAPARAVPQVEQKRPAAGVPHEGQGSAAEPGAGAEDVGGGVVIPSKVVAGRERWQHVRRPFD